MREKIKDALRTEYANTGFSEAVLDGVAALLEKTISGEDGIADAVKSEGAKAVFTARQSELDRLRTEKSALQKELEGFKAKPKDGTEKEQEKDKGAEVSPDLKEALKAVADLTARLDGMERKRQSERTLAEAKKILADGGASNAAVLDLVMKDASLSDGEDSAKAAERLRKEYDETYRRFYGDGPRPGFGKGSQGSSKGSDDKAFAEYLRSRGKLPKE